MFDRIVIGGGAAGIFSAIITKSMNPHLRVLLLEKSATLLAKVRISGGGRCNVTHHCFEPKKLIRNYPRGERELMGPFHCFGPEDTFQWFEERGVTLKVEEDGRVFPTTDNSETIITCLLSEAKKVGVEIRLMQRVTAIFKDEKGFKLTLEQGDDLECQELLLATGSSPQGFDWAASFGHQIQKAVPSLFTFNVPSSPLKELSGISWNPVELHIEGTSYFQKGPLLITHFGFSGPAALRLSAWAARYLHEKKYRVNLAINWLPQFSEEEIMKKLLQIKESSGNRSLFSENPFQFPKNLWKALLQSDAETLLAHLSLKKLRGVAQKLHADGYSVDGKTVNKEEFVTCGGITLKEIDFKTMQSKICPGLFFAGEILDIDGITGGFNFQNAWTTAYIAGNKKALY